MKVTIVCLCLCLVSVYSKSIGDADKCKKDDCTGGCRCSSTDSPLADAEIPQLVSLTFDEAIVDNLYVNVWEPLLFDRKNPDGNSISGTFFVPHEYTDYSRVQDLYLKGFEIGVHSITKNSSAEYWSSATTEILTEEFQGQQIIISNFANIPEEDIIGVRTPQLQLQGDNSLKAYLAAGLQYDSSWTSRSTAMFFPYTLDYLSTQECRSGTTCPKESHPGFWIAPIIDLQGNGTDGSVLECNSLLSCNIQGSADEIATWLLNQLERERSTKRAPLTLMVNSAWFRVSNNSLEGLQKFLDTVQTMNDVFLVSQKQVIDWAKNPVPLDQFKTEVPERTGDCSKVNCKLDHPENDGGVRYMMSCVPCPEVYPWLGNPLGQLDPTPPPTKTTSEPTTPDTTTANTETTTPEPEPTTTEAPTEGF